MATTLISIYDHLATADLAREELLASGFPADCIHLDARETEAGPAKGNFTVGDAGKDRENKPGLIFASNNDEVYDRDYANAEYRAEIMLTVDAQDDQQSDKAADILHRHGAIRVDRSSGARM
ncbi:hypothetical protein EDC30_10341 [Paucimonas lemoignei]|uniref:Heat induced stress protein YflT n=1 Tax=Paucimonas lemoignei TaxID=29443 RepID=A0A4R3I1L0_PAULE|nr:hypothetical protein [Paucimonas lemoignei]TCS37749.1 hypothetical protein EDC30_10341 [Paucimonas lemoignei]